MKHLNVLVTLFFVFTYPIHGYFYGGGYPPAFPYYVGYPDITFGSSPYPIYGNDYYDRLRTFATKDVLDYLTYSDEDVDEPFFAAATRSEESDYTDAESRILNKNAFTEFFNRVFAQPGKASSRNKECSGGIKAWHQYRGYWRYVWSYVLISVANFG